MIIQNWLSFIQSVKITIGNYENSPEYFEKTKQFILISEIMTGDISNVDVYDLSEEVIKYNKDNSLKAAIVLTENGQWNEALAIINKLGSYNDSLQYGAYCNAKLAEAKKDYKAALDYYYKCLNVLDSPEVMAEVVWLYANTGEVSLTEVINECQRVPKLSKQMESLLEQVYLPTIRI